MRQTTAPLPAPVIKTYGRYTITASRTIEGGYAINTTAATSAHRYDELSFTTPDREAFRLLYRVIGNGGIAGRRPDEVREDLRQVLSTELHAIQRRRDKPSQNRAWLINELLDLVDPISQVEIDRLAASVSNIACKPRTFKDLKQAPASRVERDRREMAARKAVA